MPIDTSMYQMAQPTPLANPMDTMAKAMTMKQLAYQNQAQDRQLADDQAYRQAFSKNITTDANGNPVLNQQGTLSDLAKTAPMKFLETQHSLNQMNAQNREAQLKDATQKTELMHTLSMSVHDQASLDDALSRARAAGIPESALSQVSPVYDPGNINQVQLHTADIKTQLDKQNKDRDYDFEFHKTYGGMPAAPGAQGSQASSGQATQSQNGSSSKSTDIDPATLVKNKVPVGQQQKVYDEIDAAQNTTRNASKILEAFDNAASKLHAVDFVPGMANVDQKALHALMGPTFKDVEGTVRQAAMDNMNNNTTPQFGDDANTIATKRAALVGYLTSKSSAPVAKGNRIDLTKYPSTQFVPDADKKDPGKDKPPAPPVGSTYDYNGKTYKVVGGNWVKQ